MIFRSLTLASLVWGSTFVSAGSWTVAAEPAPSWTLVPDETVLIARVPGGTSFVEALRDQTKLGSKLLSPERLQKLADLVGADDKLLGQEETAARDHLRGVLARLNLKSDDLGELFRGEIGYALVVEPRGGSEPLAVGLAWLEPGGDLAERLVKAIQTSVEESQDTAHPMRRVDLDLAGNEVIHLSIPYVEEDSEGVDFEGLGIQPGQPVTEEQVREIQERNAKRQENAKRHEVGRTNFLVARLGNRLLAANTFPESHRELLGDDLEHPNTVDWDEATGLETAKGIFARFLQAHAGESTGAMPRLTDAPGLSEVLPAGVPIFELLADARPLLKLADTADSAEAKRFVETLGIDALGPIAYRSALDGTLLRSGLYVSAPAPRRGLLGLLDQAALPAELPDWAPANVLQFLQFSFDLGKLYEQIKEMATAQAGAQVQMVFTQIDEQLNGALQTDLASLLASLGTTHTMITFPTRADAAPAQPNPLAGLVPTINARIAFVWQLRDEQLWKRVVQFVNNFAQRAGGFIVPAEEQGFSGIRVKQYLEGGLFVGRGYLLLGIGPEVCESVLAALRTPPSGSAALRTSVLHARANELLTQEPALIYSLTDAGSSLKGTRQALMLLLQGPLGMVPGGLPGMASAPTPEQAALIEKIKALLPTDDELEGAAGVSVSQTMVNDKGLVSQSVLELPAP